MTPTATTVTEELPDLIFDDEPTSAPIDRPAPAPVNGEMPEAAPEPIAPPASESTAPSPTPRSPSEPSPITWLSGAPTVPTAAPSASPTPTSTDAGSASGPGPAPDEESGDSDLDRFFAALRQVVHDARERVVLEGDDQLAGGPAVGEVPPMAAVPPVVAGAAAADPVSNGTVVPTRPDPVNGSAAASLPELAPTTAELIASLEADRDLWRERAVVWRERAMGADMLVKTLNEHMSDLKINLEDLRLAMRVLSREQLDAAGPRAELPAPSPRWSGLDRYLEPGA